MGIFFYVLYRDYRREQTFCAYAAQSAFVLVKHLVYLKLDAILNSLPTHALNVLVVESKGFSAFSLQTGF
jgi:hypothetical protein